MSKIKNQRNDEDDYKLREQVVKLELDVIQKSREINTLKKRINELKSDISMLDKLAKYPKQNVTYGALSVPNIKIKQNVIIDIVGDIIKEIKVNPSNPTPVFSAWYPFRNQYDYSIYASVSKKFRMSNIIRRMGFWYENDIKVIDAFSNQPIKE